MFSQVFDVFLMCSGQGPEAPSSLLFYKQNTIMTRKYKSLLMGMAFTAMLTGCADTAGDLGQTDNSPSDVALQLAVKGVKPH